MGEPSGCRTGRFPLLFATAHGPLGPGAQPLGMVAAAECPQVGASYTQGQLELRSPKVPPVR